ncbi:MAG: helix-turn-helix domain-containing protein [Verrucomicrobia bacterium]|nr:helix-turn-helix domain-containing protein [Verrucomicrobiota bacterium]
MATLGQQLKAAREAKGVSESEAGAATRILTKLIVAMEADDFSVMPAPTYAKGFIRLYAEYLELDPAPLVAEYLEKNVTGSRPLIDENRQREQNSRRGTPFSVRLKKIPIHMPHLALPGKIGTLVSRKTRSLGQAAGKGWNALPGNAWKDIRVLAGAATALFILILLISTLSNCGRKAETSAPAPQAAPARMLLDEPVPDLYLVAPGTIESSR